jgi:hypothetical protein
LANFILVDDLALADVFLLNGEIFVDETLLSRTRSCEAGLVLILAPNMTETQASNPNGNRRTTFLQAISSLARSPLHTHVDQIAKSCPRELIGKMGRTI